MSQPRRYGVDTSRRTSDRGRPLRPPRDVITGVSDKSSTPGKPKGTLGDLVKAESMIQLALALPIGCVVGWFLGSWVDHHFGTKVWGVVGILIGAAGGFIKIYTTAAKYMKDPE